MLIFMMLIGLPSHVNGQMEKALNEPIVEGESMFGIKLGDSEVDVAKKIGFPDRIISNYMDIPPDVGKIKGLGYSINEHAIFSILTRNGKVDVMQITWSGVGSVPCKGKTTKGIGLGDPIENVVKLYGKCEIIKELCWHRKYGVAINAFWNNKMVTNILVTSPGEPPAYLFTKQFFVS
jgi:hypothetical protein